MDIVDKLEPIVLGEGKTRTSISSSRVTEWMDERFSSAQSSVFLLTEE